MLNLFKHDFYKGSACQIRPGIILFVFHLFKNLLQEKKIVLKDSLALRKLVGGCDVVFGYKEGSKYSVRVSEPIVRGYLTNRTNAFRFLYVLIYCLHSLLLMRRNRRKILTIITSTYVWLHAKQVE